VSFVSSIPLASGDSSITTHADFVLVPGDKFLITEGMILPCDAILMNGKVLVDESMLTGESIPVCKVPIDSHIAEQHQQMDEGTGERGSTVSGSEGRKLINEKIDFSSPSSPLDQKHSSHLAVLKECRIPSYLKPEDEATLLDPYAKMTGNILFSGTKVKVCYGENCYAIVYKTSFRSAKGQLVSSLLKPKEGFVTFISDAINAILCMLILVTLFYILTAYILYQHGLPLGVVLFRYLDAISIAVPPALTACLTISTGISIDRLKKKSIYVADTTRVNFAGVISAVCFDKTGTLTESELVLEGVYCRCEGFTAEKGSGNGNDRYDDYKIKEGVEGDGEGGEEAVSESRKGNELKEVHRISEDSTGISKKPSSSSSSFLRKKPLPFACQEIMSTCHSLAFEKNSTTPIGDPLEVELYLASQWKLQSSSSGSSFSGNFYVTPPHTAASSSSHSGSFSSPLSSAPSSKKAGDGRYEILKHFEFTPERLRAASIVKEPSGRLMYLLKGSPEIIVKLCDPNTLPINIEERLGELARKGYRVIALASKECFSTDLVLSQEMIEKQLPYLCFYGLVYLSSALKGETKQTITSLRLANIHTNMITGDHINTAIAVAGDCGIIGKIHPLHSSSSSAGSVGSVASTSWFSVISSFLSGKPMFVSSSVSAKKNKGFSQDGSGNGNNVTGGNNEQLAVLSSEAIEYLTYIIDEIDGDIKVLNAANGKIMNISLATVIYYASQSYLLQLIQANRKLEKEISKQSLLVSTFQQKTQKRSFVGSDTGTGSRNGGRSEGNRRSGSHLLRDETEGEGGADLENGGGGPTALSSVLSPSSSSSSKQKIMKVELALTGKALKLLQKKASTSAYSKKLLRDLIHYAKIFARMKPHDKKYVVESLKETKIFEDCDRELEGEDTEEDSTTGNISRSNDDIESGVISQLHAASPLHASAASNSSLLRQSNQPRRMSGSSPSRRGIGGTKRQNSLFNKSKRVLTGGGPEGRRQYGENYDVLFCGDGANDMVALRGATIGVSLCDAETSVAAPITSKIQTPFSVVDVMCEGRASLITAYVLILFTLMYGLIQLFFTLELYYFGLLVGDNMYIIQDLVYTLVLGYTMCKAEASSTLSIQQPPKRFLISHNIVKFLIMIALFLLFQILSLFILSLQGFYTAYQTDDPLSQTYAYESSIIFNISLGQIMIASIVCSIDQPFRQNWYSNKYHTGLLFFETIWLLVQILTQNSRFLQDTLQIKPVPIYFGFIEIAILILHGLICIGIDSLLDYCFLVRWNQHWTKDRNYNVIKEKLLLKNHPIFSPEFPTDDLPSGSSQLSVARRSLEEIDPTSVLITNSDDAPLTQGNDDVNDHSSSSKKSGLFPSSKSPSYSRILRSGSDQSSDQG
jgi:magnesium-transporting ATPase (P-type)